MGFTRKILFLLSLLLCFYQTEAKTTKLDSAYSISGEDQVKAYLELGEFYLKNRSDSTLFFGQLVVDIASDLDNDSLVAEGMSLIGDFYSRTHQPEEALVWYDKLKHYAFDMRDTNWVSSAYASLGLGYLRCEKYDSAIYLLDKAEFYKIHVNDSIGLAKVYNNMGLVYQYIGGIDRSLEYFYKSLEIKKGLKDTLGMVRSYNNLGLAELNTGQYEDAAEHFRLILELNRDYIHNKRVESVGNNNYGRALTELGRYDEAMQALSHSMTLREERNDEVGKAKVWVNYGYWYQNVGQLDSAEFYYIISDRTFKDKGLFWSRFDPLVGLTEIYYHQGEVDRSLLKGNVAIELCDSLQILTPTLISLYDITSKCYKSKGNYELALEYLEKMNKVEDSTSTNATLLKIKDFEAKRLEERSNQQIDRYKIALDDAYKSEADAETYLKVVLLAFVVALLLLGFLYELVKKDEKSRKKLERQKTQIEMNNIALNEERQRVEKALKAKSEFIASVSHEIRTPMNGIIGMSDLLAETPLNKQQKEYLNNISSSSHNLLVLLNDILDFSKLESEKLLIDLRAENLYQIVDETLYMFFMQYNEKGLRFEVFFDEDIPEELYIDSNRIRQILINLLSNALKFTQEGYVRLIVKLISFRESSNKYKIEFSVKDSGIGIAKNKLADIFNSFTQEDASISRKYGGVGLGLAISQKLAKLMGGIMTVNSKQGEGAEFNFTINAVSKSVDEKDSSLTERFKGACEIYPLSKFGEVEFKNPKSAAEIKEEARNSKQADALENAEDQLAKKKFAIENPLKILVAEDNAINSQLLKIHLVNMGYTPTMVENGEEAYNRIKSDQFDIVLMDIQMPVLDGVSATKKIIADQDILDKPIIVAVTANVIDTQKKEYEECGMNDFMSKPYKLEELKQVLGKWSKKKEG